jgi:hypothetical protein
MHTVFTLTILIVMAPVVIIGVILVPPAVLYLLAPKLGAEEVTFGRACSIVFLSSKPGVNGLLLLVVLPLSLEMALDYGPAWLSVPLQGILPVLWIAVSFVVWYAVGADLSTEMGISRAMGFIGSFLVVIAFIASLVLLLGYAFLAFLAVP